MKTHLKYFYLLLLFVGMLFSCFQFTLNQLSKRKKETVSSYAMEKDSDESSEEESENIKKEIEDLYFVNNFEHSFFEFQNTNNEPYLHLFFKIKQPALSINTPPPKV